MEEYFAHFSENIDRNGRINDQNIKEYATEVVLKSSRYIFTYRKGRQQYGYCTHCQKEYKTDLRHNGKAECPKCGSICTVKASGMGRKTLIDEAYFVYYKKSLLEPEIITAQGFLAIRDYTGDYRKVETQYLDLAAYIFEYGKKGIMLKRCYGYYSEGTMQYGEYIHTASVYTMFNYNHIGNIPTYICGESIEAAVKDTPFQYSTWESYAIEPLITEYFDDDSNKQVVKHVNAHNDMVEFFDLYSKYPCVEYLTKLNFDNLVRDKLAGSRTYSAVNWRGKNLFNVLKINKQELNDIKTQDIFVTFEFLKLLQLSRKDGSNFSVKEAEEISSEYARYYLDELEEMMQYAKLRKITTYLDTQYKKHQEHFRSQIYVLTAWQDYIKDCQLLDLDTSQEAVFFPSNLYQAHQNTIKQIKINKNEILDQQIQARVTALQKYCMSYRGLFIRPAASTSELIDEGSKLHHCVGTYADRYAKGQTVILFLRKVSEPDTPFYTVEIRINHNDVFQVRGKHNCPGDEDEAVAEFIEVFTERKLSQKGSKKKVSVPA